MKFINKTIEYGLYLLVFALPIQTRWIIKAGELEYGTYSLYGTDILLILLVLLFVVKTVYSWIAGHPPVPNGTFGRGARDDNNPLNPPLQGGQIEVFRNDKMLWWFIGGLLFISAISVLFAINKPLAIYKLGWLILGAGLFWLIVKASYNRLKLIYAILGGIFLQAVLGIWQFLSQSSFANKWLGLSLHNAADLGTSVVQAIGADGVGERWLRAYGGLDHPNILGGVLTIGIILVINQILFCEKCFRITNYELRITNKMQNAKFNCIILYTLYFILLTFTVALFFSFSRTAWLGLAIGLAIMMLLAVVRRNLKLQKGLAEIILVMGIALFILFSQYQNLVTARLTGEGRLENKSTSERLVSYQESWQMIKNNWLTGVGLGNYTLTLNWQTPNQNSVYYQSAYNVFLLVWAEVGIVGLLFFIGVLFVIASDNLFRHSGRRAGIQFGRENRVSGLRVKPAMTGCFMAPRNDSVILIALIVIMSLDHWLFSLHFGVLFFWLVLGLIMSGERDEKLFLNEGNGFPPARE